MRRPMTVAALALLIAAPLSAQQLETTPSWNGTSSISSFGPGGTSTYGQTFYALNTSLDGFSFWLQDYGGGSFGSTFSAHVAAWDGNSITGPILWSSGSIAGLSGTAMNEYHVNTGGLTLALGTQYIAFFHALTGAGAWVMGGMWYTDPYPQGGFAYFNTADGAPGLADLGNDWDGASAYYTQFEAAFVADFSEAGSGQEVVPEPATMSLMALGLAGMAGARRRRKTA